MNMRTKRLVLVIGIIFAIFGIVFSISGAIKNNYPILIASFISAVIGIILIAYVFD